MKKTWIICFVLLLLSLPVRAQWSADIDLKGGFGYMPVDKEDSRTSLKHILGEGTVSLRHRSPHWLWSVTLDGQYEPVGYDTERGTLKNLFSYDLKTTQSLPFSTGVRTDLSWTPRSGQKYTGWASYRYRQTEEQVMTSTVAVTTSDEDSGIESVNLYYELPNSYGHWAGVGLGTSHELGSPRRVLESSLSVETDTEDQNNIWFYYSINYLFKDEGRFYSITPSNHNLNASFKVHLRDSVLRGPVKLMLDPGIRINTQHKKDENSGATLDFDRWMATQEQVWKDSTRLRETFDFLTVKAEPYLAAHLSWKNLDVTADYALQFYGRRLNDDSHYQPLTLHGVYPVGNGAVSLKLGKYHRLSLKNSLGVYFPNYFQICWYERTGGYINQLFRGNVKLHSTVFRANSLEYELKTSHFVSSTSLSLRRTENEVDQTWSEEVIEERTYKVFTWVNSSDSWTVGFRQKLGFKSKVVTANLDVGYNHSNRVARESALVFQTSDWSLGADAEVRLGKGWSFRADARYQSPVATFFSLFGEYCVLNARIQKEWKKVTLYLEGRDLLDKERQTYYSSADQNEIWLENDRRNRRLGVLGMKWSF